jgi:hypothetical protein
MEERMKLKNLTAPLPLLKFWENQNQKLFAHPCFLQEKGSLFDDELYFNNKNEFVTKIDFSTFDLPHIKIDDAANIEIEGQSYTLSAKEYAKLFFITSIPTANPSHLVGIYQMVVHLFAFLNAKKSLVLSIDYIEDFWVSLLGESIDENGFYNCVATPNHNGVIKPISLPKARNNLQALGVVGVIDNSLTPKKLESMLDDVCQSQLGITLNEYKQGGSFNFLGLELGQYYVDYLRLVYQKDYFYMMLCKKTLKKIIAKYEVTSFDSAASTGLNNVILSALTGLELVESRYNTKGINHEGLIVEVKNTVHLMYKKYFESTMSLNEKCIKELVLELGLGMRFDAVEVVRILMLQKFYGLEGHKTSEGVWNSYLISLDKTFIDSNKLADMTLDEVYSKMKNIIMAKKLKKGDFLTNFKAWGRTILEGAAKRDYKSFKTSLNTIISAMTTLAVSWLGYRKSEFGFPLSAIYTEKNMDILDNSHVPFRFKLKWFVPKTNGKTKIDREITSQCYQIAVQLNDIFDGQEGSPCLYDTSSKSIQVHNVSTRCIESRVKANWTGFVTNYPPFNDSLLLNTLAQKSKGSLSTQEKSELDRLDSIYDTNSAKYKHLLSTAKEVKRDWKRLNCTSFNSGKTQAKFKNSLSSFIKTGEIPNLQHKELVKSYLSDDTKSLLRSGSVVLNNKAMMDIANEILQGVRYPSPHSFRHIWAEAVLTRYQGDVGTVIRHQFCHLDESFFMAYLRDKDVRGLMKGARQRYLNSIVELLMLDSDKIGKEYIGGFSRYVKKAIGLTKTLSESEFRALREGINGRIISIKPSHFAMCIPREGAENRAKCAKFDSINPQDAKPEFCLNCTHAVITSGNIRGIWTTIQPMVKEALNENLMGFMLEGHLPTLRSGYKRIKELQPASSSKKEVTKILDATKTAISAIEAKLEQ